MRELVKIYWLAALLTALIWAATGYFMGLAALGTVIILTLLETTFSADNAVVNSKVLVTLSPFWRQLFMTLGIFVAVFLVRFVLPIFIVMLGTSLPFGQVIDLALNHTEEYGAALEKAAPIISSFGGTFLLMIALSYFIDYEKRTHWLGWLEKRLGKLGQYDNITTFIMLLATLALYVSVDAVYQPSALIAGIAAMTLHSGLSILDALFTTNNYAKTIKRGLAGFAAFMYLEVLDTSFSLDGVVGAFALTNNVILIMAGLGAGAIWVRAITVHLIKADALSKYVYLEHGAHWAIGLLGLIMLVKLYGVELPEWFVGSVGLVCIALAIGGSMRRKQP